MYLPKNSRYVLQKAPWLTSNLLRHYTKKINRNYSARFPKDDPSKPPLRLNIPKDPPVDPFQNLFSQNSNTAEADGSAKMFSRRSKSLVCRSLAVKGSYDLHRSEGDIHLNRKSGQTSESEYDLKTHPGKNGLYFNMNLPNWNSSQKYQNFPLKSLSNESVPVMRKKLSENSLKQYDRPPTGDAKSDNNISQDLATEIKMTGKIVDGKPKSRAGVAVASPVIKEPLYDTGKAKQTSRKLKAKNEVLSKKKDIKSESLRPLTRQSVSKKGYTKPATATKDQNGGSPRENQVENMAKEAHRTLAQENMQAKTVVIMVDSFTKKRGKRRMKIPNEIVRDQVCTCEKKVSLLSPEKLFLRNDGMDVSERKSQQMDSTNQKPATGSKDETKDVASKVNEIRCLQPAPKALLVIEPDPKIAGNEIVEKNPEDTNQPVAKRPLTAESAPREKKMTDFDFIVMESSRRDLESSKPLASKYASYVRPDPEQKGTRESFINAFTTIKRKMERKGELIINFAGNLKDEPEEIRRPGFNVSGAVNRKVDGWKRSVRQALRTLNEKENREEREEEEEQQQQQRREKDNQNERLVNAMSESTQPEEKETHKPSVVTVAAVEIEGKPEQPERSDKEIDDLTVDPMEIVARSVQTSEQRAMVKPEEVTMEEAANSPTEERKNVKTLKESSPEIHLVGHDDSEVKPMRQSIEPVKQEPEAEKLAIENSVTPHDDQVAPEQITQGQDQIIQEVETPKVKSVETRKVRESEDKEPVEYPRKSNMITSVYTKGSYSDTQTPIRPPFKYIPEDVWAAQLKYKENLKLFEEASAKQARKFMEDYPEKSIIEAKRTAVENVKKALPDDDVKSASSLPNLRFKVFEAVEDVPEVLAESSRYPENEDTIPPEAKQFESEVMAEQEESVYGEMPTAKSGNSDILGAAQRRKLHFKDAKNEPRSTKKIHSIVKQVTVVEDPLEYLRYPDFKCSTAGNEDVSKPRGVASGGAMRQLHYSSISFGKLRKDPLQGKRSLIIMETDKNSLKKKNETENINLSLNQEGEKARSRFTFMDKTPYKTHVLNDPTKQIICNETTKGIDFNLQKSSSEKPTTTEPENQTDKIKDMNVKASYEFPQVRTAIKKQNVKSCKKYVNEIHRPLFSIHDTLEVYEPNKVAEQPRLISPEVVQKIIEVSKRNGTNENSEKDATGILPEEKKTTEQTASSKKTSKPKIILWERGMKKTPGVTHYKRQLKTTVLYPALMSKSSLKCHPKSSSIRKGRSSEEKKRQLKFKNEIAYAPQATAPKAADKLNDPPQEKKVGDKHHDELLNKLVQKSSVQLINSPLLPPADSKLSDNILNIANSEIAETKGTPSIDSLSLMKEVKGMLEVDLKNAIKIFAPEERRVFRLASVVYLRGDNWEWAINHKELEECRKANGPLEIEGSYTFPIPEPVHHPKCLPEEYTVNEMCADLITKTLNAKEQVSMEAQTAPVEMIIEKQCLSKDSKGSSSDKPESGMEAKKEHDETPAKIEEPFRRDSVVILDPDTLSFRINEDELKSIIKINELERGLFLSDSTQKLLLKAGRGESVIVYDDQKKTWKVDFSILEQTRKREEFEDSLQRRSEKILEIMEKQERAVGTVIESPKTGDRHVFDYASGSWKHYIPKKEEPTDKLPIKKKDEQKEVVATKVKPLEKTISSSGDKKPAPTSVKTPTKEKKASGAKPVPYKSDEIRRRNAELFNNVINSEKDRKCKEESQQKTPEKILSEHHADSKSQPVLESTDGTLANHTASLALIEGKEAADAVYTKKTETGQSGDHYVSDNIIKKSKNGDRVGKLKETKVETLIPNLNTLGRRPSKVTEMNIKKAEEKKTTPPPPSSAGVDNKNFFRKFEKYKSQFSDPDFEEKPIKINADIKSNPNLKKLDSINNKTVVLHDNSKSVENLEGWLKEETDKMASLLIKVLQEASDGNRRVAPQPPKPPPKDNPYDTIRRKNESNFERMVQKERNFKNKLMENHKPPEPPIKAIPVQSAKNFQPPKVVDIVGNNPPKDIKNQVKPPEANKASKKKEESYNTAHSSYSTLQLRDGTTPPRREDAPPQSGERFATDYSAGHQDMEVEILSPHTLMQRESNLGSRRIAQIVLKPDVFKEVPGPEVLKKFSVVWKSLPAVSCQATVSVMMWISQIIRVGSVFTGTSTKAQNNHSPFGKFFNKYGPVVKLQCPFGGEVVLINRPEHIASIYSQENNSPVRSTFDSVEKYWVRAKEKVKQPFRMSGSEWDGVRKTTEDPFVKGGEKYFVEVEDVAEVMVKRIANIRNKQNEVPPSFMGVINRWSLECVCNVVFDKSLGFLLESGTPVSDPERLYKAFTEATEGLCRCEIGFQLWRFFGTPASFVLAQACETIDGVISKYIRQAQLDLLKRKEELTSDLKTLTSQLSFIESMLLNDCLTPEEIAANILDLFIVGANTASSALAFQLYHLAKNPRAQERLFDELKEYLPEKKSRLRYHQLHSLKYLQACLKESLRLNMPMPVVVRVLNDDVVLSNYKINEGTYVVMDSQISSFQESKFKETERFVPERWMEVAELHPLATVPFCHGPRADIGKRLAEMQLWSCIAKIIRNYKVEYNYEEINGQKNVISYPDRPLKLTFIERED